jgi:penicillin-binding protein 2
MIINKRIYVVLMFILICSLGLAGRLFYLQIHEGKRLAKESLHNRIHEFKIGQERGNILDRNGIMLTNTAKRNEVVVFLGKYLTRRR